MEKKKKERGKKKGRKTLSNQTINFVLGVPTPNATNQIL